MLVSVIPEKELICESCLFKDSSISDEEKEIINNIFSPPSITGDIRFSFNHQKFMGDLTRCDYCGEGAFFPPWEQINCALTAKGACDTPYNWIRENKFRTIKECWHGLTEQKLGWAIRHAVCSSEKLSIVLALLKSIRNVSSPLISIELHRHVITAITALEEKRSRIGNPDADSSFVGNSYSLTVAHLALGYKSRTNRILAAAERSTRFLNRGEDIYGKRFIDVVKGALPDGPRMKGSFSFVKTMMEKYKVAPSIFLPEDILNEDRDREGEVGTRE